MSSKLLVKVVKIQVIDVMQSGAHIHDRQLGSALFCESDVVGNCGIDVVSTVRRSRSIQVSELSNLMVDLNLGEGDVDLDAALAEMEIEDVDDNMDGKLGKEEFMKWLAAKKAELADMEGGAASGSNANGATGGSKHQGVIDANAWGDDPQHLSLIHI